MLRWKTHTIRIRSVSKTARYFDDDEKRATRTGCEHLCAARSMYTERLILDTT